MDKLNTLKPNQNEFSPPRWRSLIDRIVYGNLAFTAALTIVVTALIIGCLVYESRGFFQEVRLTDFLFGTTWTPLFEPREYGVLPILWGTMMIAIGSSIIAIPLGVGMALYFNEFASHKTRKVLKPIIEVLAGIPSVVFGFFALTTITPMLRAVIPQTEVFNAASAAIVLGIMVLPLITSISDDAIHSLPRSLKESAYACGATKMEVCLGVLLPAAASGITASIILGFSRAIGETMAVTLAAGSTPSLSLNPLQGIQTMTAYIVQVCMGDVAHGSAAFNSIFAVALLLFFITLVLNILSQKIIRRLAKEYS